MPPDDADFSFTIDFEKGAGDPRRSFDSASALIEGFELADGALVNIVDGKIKTLTVLEDVEGASIKVWLKKTLTLVVGHVRADRIKRRLNQVTGSAVSRFVRVRQGSLKVFDHFGSHPGDFLWGSHW